MTPRTQNEIEILVENIERTGRFYFENELYAFSSKYRLKDEKEISVFKVEGSRNTMVISSIFSKGNLEYTVKNFGLLEHLAKYDSPELKIEDENFLRVIYFKCRDKFEINEEDKIK